MIVSALKGQCALNPEPQVLNTELETLNPKPSNLKSYTLNPKSVNSKLYSPPKPACGDWSKFPIIRGPIFEVPIIIRGPI